MSYLSTRLHLSMLSQTQEVSNQSQPIRTPFVQVFLVECTKHRISGGEIIIYFEKILVFQ